MMKFVFVIAFVLVALSAANALRVPRDAPTIEDAPKAIENAMNQIQEFFKNSFSQDQLEKFGKEFQDMAAKVSAKGKEIAEELTKKKE